MILQQLIRRLLSGSQPSAFRRSHRRKVPYGGAMIEILEPRKLMSANVITVQNSGSYVYLTDFVTPSNAAQGDSVKVTYNATATTFVGQNGTKFQVGSQTVSTLTINSATPLHLWMYLNSPASTVDITGDGVAKLASVDMNFGYLPSTNSLALTDVIVDSTTVFGAAGNDTVRIENSIFNQTLLTNLGNSNGDTLILFDSQVHGSVTGSANLVTLDHAQIDGMVFLSQPGSAPTLDSTASTYNGFFLDILGNDAVINMHGSVDGPNTFNSAEILIGVVGHDATLNVDQVPSAPSAGVVNKGPAPILIGVQNNPSEPVLTWNNQALRAIMVDKTPPPKATRALAIMHAAILDVVNAINGTPGLFVSMTANKNTSAAAAVAAAADRVLSTLFPAQKATFDALLAQELGQIIDLTAKNNGVTLGNAIADAMIQLRQNDGSNKTVTFSGPTTPGSWQPTPPAYAAPLLPQWGNVTPFVISTVSAYVPSGPPPLNCDLWTAAYNEVKSLGAVHSTTRTADQTQIALFWADGGGTFTPPGHWNAIANQLIAARHMSLSQSARLMAELNLGMADAGIVAWNTKYTYDSWRPITAIQNVTSAVNSQVTADLNWQPLLTTPNFPEYISGHSTFSATAAEILTAAFGDNVSFTTTSIGLPGVQRTFSSFQAAAQEAGRSRIYGGIHFEFANQDGLATGKKIGDAILQSFAAHP